MAKGRTYLFTVGYTEDGAGVTRSYYPLKKKYKLVVETQYPKFPDSYELVSPSAFWFPYQNITPTDLDYIPYTPGDEFGWVDNQAQRPSEIVVPAPNFRRQADIEETTRIVYGGHVYVSTSFFFYWSDTKFDQTKNPYRGDRVRKWRKLSDTSTNWVQYWYHPQLKKFFVLDTDDAVQLLPDPDDFDPTKWDSFIGAARKTDLSNFTLEQIR